MVEEFEKTLQSYIRKNKKYTMATRCFSFFGKERVAIVYFFVHQALPG